MRIKSSIKCVLSKKDCRLAIEPIINACSDQEYHMDGNLSFAPRADATRDDRLTSTNPDLSIKSWLAMKNARY